MASAISSGGSSDNNTIPQWKRDLIIRRRTSNRASGTINNNLEWTVAGSGEQVDEERTSGVSNIQRIAVDHGNQQDFHLQSTMCSSVVASVGKMKLLGDVDVVRDLNNTSNNMINNNNSYVKFLVDDKNTIDKKCQLFQKADKKFNTNCKMKKYIYKHISNGKEDSSGSDSSEELQYGPGIVNRLKTKYLSMTLRENQKRGKRASLSNIMRKATSLDNLLENDNNNNNNNNNNNSVLTHVNKLEFSYNNTSNETVDCARDLQRARSMETLHEDAADITLHNVRSIIVNKPKITSHNKSIIKSNNNNNNNNNNDIKSINMSIVNEDIVIIENNNTSIKKEIIENKELPPTDVVKETLKIFENCQIRNKRNFNTKLESQIIISKPILLPKPSIDNSKIQKKQELRNGADKENPVSLLKINFETNTLIQNRSNHFSIKTRLERQEPLKIKNSSHEELKPPLRPSRTITKCVPSKLLEKDLNDGIQVTCEISNPSKETDVDIEIKSISEKSEIFCAEPAPVRQVGIIRPLINETQIEEEVKESAVVEEKNENCNGVVSAVNKPTLWQCKPWNQQQNTMVFNFSNRKDVPDYIENDGLLLARNDRNKIVRNNRVLLIKEGDSNNFEESSTDDKDDWNTITGRPPSPCNISFENDNVLINGKSNIKKQSNNGRKLSIQFSDSSTTFEYPSEASLLQEFLSNEIVEEKISVKLNNGQESSITDSNKLPSVIGTTGLANYVPSKLGAGDNFELGMKRSTDNNNCIVQNGTESKQKENDEYFKPAEGIDSMAWSEESIPDLLF